MNESAQRELLTGLVEMDETYIGGKPRRGSKNDHKRGRGTSKIPVIGMAQWGGKIKAKAKSKKGLQAKHLSALVRRHIDIENATLITDEYKGYIRIKIFMSHETVDHKVWYVDGFRHTNTIESFWALLKRGLIGQFHKVSIKHLPKYLDEFCYRYNYRGHSNLFGLTISKSLWASYV